MRKSRFVWSAVLVAGWLGAPGGMARAELRVIESNAPGIARDAAFADDAAFDVPSGTKIKLLKGSSTFEIVGPYKGTLAGYSPQCGWWARMRGECTPVTEPVGGTRSVAPVAGGTRGIRAPQQ